MCYTVSLYTHCINYKYCVIAACYIYDYTEYKILCLYACTYLSLVKLD